MNRDASVTWLRLGLAIVGVLVVLGLVYAILGNAAAGWALMLAMVGMGGLVFFGRHQRARERRRR